MFSGTTFVYIAIIFACAAVIGIIAKILMSGSKKEPEMPFNYGQYPPFDST